VELRGEEALTPLGRGPGAPLEIETRFRLAPGAAASVAVDGKSAVLRPLGGHGWRFRSDADHMRLEPAAYFQNGEPRASQVLCLHGLATPEAGVRVRWKLARDAG
jgi:uncharacterized heparinase superfamily protein